MGSVIKYQCIFFEFEYELFCEFYWVFFDCYVVFYYDEWEKIKIVDCGVWLEVGKQGFLGMVVFEEYGGGGNVDFWYNMVIIEEICVGWYSGIGFGLYNDIVVLYLLVLVIEEQKWCWFFNFCIGELIIVIVMIEFGIGSDL